MTLQAEQILIRHHISKEYSLPVHTCRRKQFEPDQAQENVRSELDPELGRVMQES